MDGNGGGGGEEDVKPDVAKAEDTKDSFTVEGRVGEEDAWAEVLDTIARLLPLLKSRSSETRSAASNALGLLASTLPPYTAGQSDGKDGAEFETASRVDVRGLLSSGQTLLASAGREYATKRLTTAEKIKRQRAMKASAGLDDMGFNEELDQLMGEAEEEEGQGEGKLKNGESSTSTPLAPKESTPSTPQDIFEGLSARQITMLKRKKGDIVAEANK